MAGAGLFIAVTVRLALMPFAHLGLDMDQFVGWVHAAATAPLGDIYRADLTFPPVMAYIFGALAALDPAFRTATTASDPLIRTLMKVPADLADLGLAAGVAWALRREPRWAPLGGLGIALHPAVVYISAAWGQFDSIYVIWALLAYLFVAADHPVPGAVMLGLSLMTKPQALPLAVPFVAYALGRYGLRGTRGLRGTLLPAAALAATVVALWLPFLAAGGPLDYLRGLGQYENANYAVLSLRAWNPWWILEQFAGGGFYSDLGHVVGPITPRLIGYALAGAGEAAVFWAVWRRATPRALALGLACASLVAFELLTTMHERYSYPALIFLALLLPERAGRWTWAAFAVVFAANVFAAVPPDPALGAVLPAGGPLGVAGSAAMFGLTVVALALLVRTDTGAAVDRAAATGNRTAAEGVRGTLAGEGDAGG